METMMTVQQAMELVFGALLFNLVVAMIILIIVKTGIKNSNHSDYCAFFSIHKKTYEPRYNKLEQKTIQVYKRCNCIVK
jgi:hypothetical protein